MTSNTVVNIIDDDVDVLRSISAMIVEMGLKAETYSSSEDFLVAYDEMIPGCVISDVRMPGICGFELQRILNERVVKSQMIFISGYADTHLTVDAMKNGAVSVLDKPFRGQELWDSVREALALDTKNRAMIAHCCEIQQRIKRLTDEERLVMELVVLGKPNKVIAIDLHAGMRTVEARRHNVFRKMKADSVAELVRMVIEGEHNGKSNHTYHTQSLQLYGQRG
ncbi:MAG: response regulator transcription factor [Planctomycetes bacterium]|nr:response regulator transcription factor [Planctomycetota bacterium]